MKFNQPSKNAFYIQTLSTQYRPLLWLFAAGLLLLGLLCARATYLQPDPILQLVLGWVTLFLLLPVLPTAFVQQQCWLDVERQQLWLGKGVINGKSLGLWRWRSYAFSDIHSVQLYLLQTTHWHQFERNRQAEDIVEHYLAYLQLQQPKGAQLKLANSTDRKELQQALQQCAQAIDCKFQDFSNTTQKSLPKGSEFNFMRVLVLLVIFILLNILYFLFVL
ncbi:hypothetical protein L5M18_09750 [Shewanella sp. SM20]|uniref:hypothetical protein n=1 Tax=unclassified Shewanella TaxID=196818 RepID=UPI0021DAB789|nr:MULTISPECIES: hypothetical protein [unclassified Shewanella]MCU7961068.1 hypothetical protein [Shewanella sp. SW32]MCU7969122.1 hypothetical protein [Shewanella sp. SW29]MCU8091844.1 hypothetical protein [Shewanella sp. SM20]